VQFSGLGVLALCPLGTQIFGGAATEQVVDDVAFFHELVKFCVKDIVPILLESAFVLLHEGFASPQNSIF